MKSGIPDHLEDTYSDHELLLMVACDVRELVTSHAQIRKTVFGNGDAGLVQSYQTLKERVDAMQKGLLWLGGILAAFILGLLWQIFTGQVTITFK